MNPEDNKTILEYQMHEEHQNFKHNCDNETGTKCNGRLTPQEDINVNNEAQATLSACYSSSTVHEKPSVCVRSLQNVKINEVPISFNVNQLKKPRTLFFVKKTEVNSLHIQSKIDTDGKKQEWSTKNLCTDEKDESTSNCVDRNINLKLPEKVNEKSDLQFMVNNDMLSLLDALESAKGVSTLFNFPTGKDNLNTEENVDLKESPVKNIDETKPGENTEFNILDISHTKPPEINKFYDHVYCSKRKVNKDTTTNKQVRKRNRNKNITDLHENSRHSVDENVNKPESTQNQVGKRYVNSSVTDEDENGRKKKRRKKCKKVRTELKLTTDCPTFPSVPTQSVEEYPCPIEETLEYVFKYERFPGSFYMDKLAKNLGLSWKLINSWFMERRIEAKKNAVIFRIQEFTHCIYCDPINTITELAIDHLISDTHIANIKNAHFLRSERRKSVELLPTDDPQVEFDVENSSDANTVIDSQNQISISTDAYKLITHKCKTCDSYFPNEWSLLRHSLTHRYILCEMCNKSFKDSAYKYHVASHLMLNCSKKLIKYCKCTVCNQLECICQSLYNFSPVNNVNYCNCRKCRRLHNDLNATLSGYSSQTKLEALSSLSDSGFCKYSENTFCRKSDCDYTSPLHIDNEEIYFKCRSCLQPDCKCVSVTPKFHKVSLQKEKLPEPYSVPFAKIHKIWAAIKELEDAHKTRIILPDVSMDVHPFHPCTNVLSKLNELTNIKANEIFFMNYRKQMSCISKTGFFEEIVDYCPIIQNKKDLNILKNDYLHIQSKYSSKLLEDPDHSSKELSIDSYLSATKKNMHENIECLEKLTFDAGVYLNYCMVCGSKKSKPEYLLLHSDEHKGIRCEFVCKKCDIKLYKYRDCIEHIFEHLQISLYICHMCSSRFSKHGDIIKHLQIEHSYANINSNSSYNWIISNETEDVGYSTMNIDSNYLEPSSVDHENVFDINSIEDIIENVAIKDEINYEEKTLQTDNEEIIDLSEIPDNIVDLSEVFETVVLTDVTNE